MVSVDPKLLEQIRKCRANIEAFHEKQEMNSLVHHRGKTAYCWDSSSDLLEPWVSMSREVRGADVFCA